MTDSIKDKFVETLSEVPPTCLEENENGNKCVRRSGHEGSHKAAGPLVHGIEIWDGDGPVAKRETGETTAQQTLFSSNDGDSDQSVDTGTDHDERGGQQ